MAYSNFLEFGAVTRKLTSPYVTWEQGYKQERARAGSIRPCLTPPNTYANCYYKYLGILFYICISFTLDYYVSLFRFGLDCKLAKPFITYNIFSVA